MSARFMTSLFLFSDPVSDCKDSGKESVLLSGLEAETSGVNHHVSDLHACI